ncbi:hypothetical protein HYV74_01905 [Candidatus Uhrbacteria bacterium]|nr:hypothetical protein [Candidatus Uhrbacteria bacterium]
MLTIQATSGIFDLPRVICTVRGNPASERVLAAIQSPEQTIQDTELAKKRASDSEQEYHVFDDGDAFGRYLEGGVSPASVVVLFDERGSGVCTMRTQSRAKDHGAIPAWTRGAQWAIGVHLRPDAGSGRIRAVAYLVLATFYRRFKAELTQEHFPWGKPRKGESGPAIVTLPTTITQTIERLNSGPDLRAAIAHHEFALELPAGSRISWIRVVPEPVTCDERVLDRAVRALQDFEVACGSLLRAHSEVAEDVLAGVTIHGDPRVRELYLHPPAARFSVDRPDLHWTGTGVFASEVDEMPGGFPDLMHLDRAYDVNQDRWARCFDWLAAKGTILFLVSDQWSKCYIMETAWLVEQLNVLGCRALLRTTSALHDVAVTADGVMCGAEAIGTIWRQFPIFETTGKLVDLVAAARRGLVRMVPEFAHWGNKTWFAMFRKHHARFRNLLMPASFDLLDEILPDSHLVRAGDPDAFPCLVNGLVMRSLAALRELPEQDRDQLVLKVCGANTLAARSYGVLMGQGLSLHTWQQWIDQRIEQQQPFLIQQRLMTGVARLPVQNTKRGCAEAFDCRILLRPWVVGGELVSAHGCAVPSNTSRVHGRVDMAVLPIRFTQGDGASVTRLPRAVTTGGADALPLALRL